MKKIIIGISPCPNDTFIFEAIYNNRIDLEGINFEFAIEDVEQLNKNAIECTYDVTKISYNAYTYVSDNYQLCNAGSALGRNCGPLLIAKNEISSKKLNDIKVAIPGKMTTANLLMSIAYPEIIHKQEMIFHEIEDAVLTEKVDMGLIIHENRFTYQDKGLVKVRDLGEFWEESTGHPIPLGGIAISRTLEDKVRKAIDRIIRKSVEYAFANPAIGKEWIEENAQEMDGNIIQQHISLYVNEFSVDLGYQGKSAVENLYEKMVSLGLLKKNIKNIFV